MAYRLKAVTICTNNSEEGIRKIAELWEDVLIGKLPLLSDGIIPISQYVFGKFGIVLLASIFTLACLTTCIGLITSISKFTRK